MIITEFPDLKTSRIKKENSKSKSESDRLLFVDETANESFKKCICDTIEVKQTNLDLNSFYDYPDDISYTDLEYAGIY